MENGISLILDPRRWLSAILLLRGLKRLLIQCLVHPSYLFISCSESEEWGALLFRKKSSFPPAQYINNQNTVWAWFGEHDWPTLCEK